MAGQEFKAKAKEVLKMNSDGATVKNLADDTEKRISQREEALNYREETSGGLPPVPFPRIQTERQNLNEFTNKKITRQRKHDILEEKHEAKLDKVTFESQQLKDDFIADKKLVSAERTEVIKSEYGSVSEYNKFQDATKTEKCRDGLIETKKSLSKERNDLIKSEFGTHADYKNACSFTESTASREKLVSAKKNLVKQRNDIVKSGDSSRANELFKVENKIAAVDGKINSESAKISKLSHSDKVSKLKEGKTRKEFVESRSKLLGMSDRLKTIDKELTSISGAIKAEGGKLNAFYSSHGLAEMKSSNSREQLKALQRKMLQKSEQLSALETKYGDLGGKIKNESAKIKAFTAEKDGIIAERKTLNSVRNTDKAKVADYKSKLKFAKSEPDGGKFEIKAAKADYRLAKAQKNLPQQRIVRKTYAFDEKSGKIKSRLKIEKEVKPINGRGGVVTKGIKGGAKAISTAAVVGIHRQISKYEEDNSALKALHGAEKVAEGAGRIGVRGIKSANKKIKEAPYKKASKLKFQSEKTNRKLNFNKTVTKNKEVVKSTAELAKKSARKNAQKTAQKLQHSVGSKAKEILQNLGKKVLELLAKNKYVVIGIIVALLLMIIIGSIAGSVVMMFSEGSGAAIASTYMSADADMRNAESYMSSLESGLVNQINNIPNVYVGWNEYRYNLAEISHDPYALVSYLSALHISFQYNTQLQADIQTLFNSLYSLQVTSIHEVRSYTTTEYDDEGNPYEVTVYYDYYILETTLIKNDFNTVVSNLLGNPDQYELYQLLLATQGNRPDLFP